MKAYKNECVNITSFLLNYKKDSFKRIISGSLCQWFLFPYSSEHGLVSYLQSLLSEDTENWRSNNLQKQSEKKTAWENIAPDKLIYLFEKTFRKIITINL